MTAMMCVALAFRSHGRMRGPRGAQRSGPKALLFPSPAPPGTGGAAVGIQHPPHAALCRNPGLTSPETLSCVRS